MATIRVREKTDQEGYLSLHLPLGRANIECEVVVTTQSAGSSEVQQGWPPGYFALAGSIDDETLVRPPQGELPPPLELDQ